MPRSAWILASISLIACLAPILARAGETAEVEPLAAALNARSTEVLAQIKKKGYKNVGVLKFLVQIGDQPPRDDVGELNSNLANKTEVALILANTDDAFGIIPNPSETVTREKMTSANHLDEDGRKAFFSRKYDLAWGEGKVDASCFLAGIASVSKDLKTMTIKYRVFDKSGAIEDLPGDISAPCDPRALAEAGFSYVVSEKTRKELGGDAAPARENVVKEIMEDAKRSAAKDDKTKDSPFEPLTASPIKLSVLINGKAAPVKFDTVPEPKETDRVEFELSNPTKETFGVVLLVNGENTLYREKADVNHCRKWILTPGTNMKINGFQTDSDTIVPFKVLTPEETDADAVNYGPHAGTFRMVVFAGTIGDKQTPPQTHPTHSEDLLAIARTRGTTTPGVKPLTLKALQADLRGRAAANTGARGLIGVGGKSEKSNIKKVFFKPNSDLPVADVSLNYLGKKK